MFVIHNFKWQRNCTQHTFKLLFVTSTRQTSDRQTSKIKQKIPIIIQIEIATTKNVASYIMKQYKVKKKSSKEL